MIFNFCNHKWKIISSGVGKETYLDGRTKDVSAILLQCEKCGNVKSEKVLGQFEIEQEAK